MTAGGNWQTGAVPGPDENAQPANAEPARPAGPPQPEVTAPGAREAQPAAQAAVGAPSGPPPPPVPPGGGRRGLSRRDALRLGLIGIGGVVVGGLGGFAIGRSTAPGVAVPHPLAGAPEGDPLASGVFPIGIADDQRTFVDAEGQAFFYLADTPWNAISRMTRESFDTLATARRDAGFTALQLSVLDFDTGAENAYGHRPFAVQGALDDPVVNEGDDYWTHVAWCIDRCAELGLVAALVPSWYGGWGDAWRGYVTEDNAGAYGSFLAERYGDRANVWWLLGGDNDPTTEGNETAGVPGGLDRGPRIAETIAMGRALAAGMTQPHLMSYHTSRERSVEEFFGDEEWYTISAAYSGADPVPYVAAEYERDTVRPIVLWESYYDERTRDPILDRRDLRAQAYRAILAGAAGYAYGHEQVWPVLEDWIPALDADSAGDITVLSRALSTYAQTPLTPITDGAPAAGLVVDGYGTPGTTSEVTAATLPDGAGALAYFGEPRTVVTIDTTALDPEAAYDIRWIDPATGEEFFFADDRTGVDVSVGWPSTWSDALLVIRR
ncbi:DUF4038 domain-containing protein [Microbacterium sp. LRZ72]|uniref:apiosidase-like domain-containing protein n=1 Tax=Microbacterium sp. LRZ72 TaxID=2942481 RepID=UPI0029B83D97|nr:DUF4038 domain-containing protein [Microbacterium sp. LRZ72]MDX2376584.1 DUF4038 domain-containing protein [Microbacterium sp. LRZ72]